MMKSLKTTLWMLVIIPAFFLSSCEKLFEAEQEGILELAVLIEQQSELKSAFDDGSAFTSHFLIVSVVDENGEIVMDNEQIELYNFGGHWITKEIRLKPGLYELTKFLVVDLEGNVLYAAPIEGSPKAYLVKDPLPIQFEIIKNKVTRVVPEVLAVIEEPPEDFGYVTFSYHIVKPLDFFIAVYLNNPLIMSPIMFTDAKLTVMVDSIWWHSFELEPIVNKVTIRDGYRCYLLIIEKEGFNPVKLKLLREELAKTTTENPLLVGIPSDSLHLLVLQPGPEEGKDAMINKHFPEKNFGDHPFFEAINNQPWISDNIDCHLLTRSLIEWDLNQLPKSATIRKALMTLYYPHIYITDPSLMDTLKNVMYSWVDSTDITEKCPRAVLQRIISPWEEYEVTWAKQPETTTENQVFIPMKYYIHELTCANCIYPPISEVIDVTKLLTGTYTSAVGHNGMMLRLVKEEYSQWFRFASSDFNSPILWPKLEIYYTLP